jgi:hypothetical protein
VAREQGIDVSSLAGEAYQNLLAKTGQDKRV